MVYREDLNYYDFTLNEANIRDLISKENVMSENLNALEKAQVLIEALPYIQRFNRKIIVVKYGGSAMVDEKLKNRSSRMSPC